MHPGKLLGTVSFALVLAITLPLVAPRPALAANTGLQIQDVGGKQITKERLLGAALSGAWQLGKSEACNLIAGRLSQPGDYSAYGVRCNLGSDVDVTTADALPDGFLLKANISRSTINSEFTQPYVGKWGDPSARIAWDSRLTVTAKLTQDGACPGVPVSLPWLRFEDASLEMVNTDVDVDSTVADIAGGIVGFFTGALFGGAAAIPLAVAGAMGTEAIIEGVASDQVPQGPFKFADQANSHLNGAFSPCELVSSFTDLAQKQLRTKSVSSGLVVLSLEQGRPVAGPGFQARHNLTGAQYQAEFDRLGGEGYRLVDVSGYQDGGAVRYAAVWDYAPGQSWQARHGMTGAQYQAAFEELGAQGWRPVRVNGFPDGGGVRFAAIWEPATAAWVGRHGMTGAEYQAEFERLGGQGFRLVDVSGYRDGGQARFAAIWEQSPGPAWQAGHGMTNAQYQAQFERLGSQGYRLVRVSGYEDGGDRYAAIWEQTGGAAWQSYHNLSAADYQAKFDQLLFEGYRLVQVSGYAVGGQARFAAIWTQGDSSGPMPNQQRPTQAPPAQPPPPRDDLVVR